MALSLRCPVATREHPRAELSTALLDLGYRLAGVSTPQEAARIIAAVKDAGLTQIDHLITTHYHGDHFGAMGPADLQYRAIV